MIIGGVVFGLFAGMDYWFPKAFGFRLDPFWGKVSFWGWVIGYWVAWTPDLHRRPDGHDPARAAFRRPDACSLVLSIAAIGALIILVGILAFVIQLVVSIMNRASSCAT